MAELLALLVPLNLALALTCVAAAGSAWRAARRAERCWHAARDEARLAHEHRRAAHVAAGRSVGWKALVNDRTSRAARS